MIYPRGRDADTWVSEDFYINSKKENLKATIFEGAFYNNFTHPVYDWELRINIEEDCYINNSWCGKMEIHKFNNGIESFQTLDLRALRNYTVELEHYYVGQEFLIPLHKGDYLIYHPKPKTESPIPEKGGNSHIGFIFYYQNDDFYISNYEVTYYLRKNVFEGHQLYIFCSLIIIWVFILIGLITYEVSRLKMQKELNLKDKIIEEALSVFSNFVDAKDSYTKGHSNRVAEYSRKIAEKMGFSESDCKNIYYIALMHDCGKCYIPDEVLKKPDKLIDEEYEIIKKHTEYGAKILENFDSVKDVYCGALYHHERYDGKGYPRGKSGEDIPLVARIICVADAYDAMNSSRCYRLPLPYSQIITEIENGKGSQFDPKIADIMLELIRSKSI